MDDYLEMYAIYFIIFCAKFIIISIFKSFLNLVQILFAMKNNLNWFESPIPKPSNFSNIHIKPEADNQPDEPMWNRQQLLSSPEANQFLKYGQNSRDLSPWSKLINTEQDEKEQALVLPGIIQHHDYKTETIEQRLIFSQEEDDELVTPMKREQTNKQENQDGQLHTTGRKSELQHVSVSKKSRPREKGLRKLSQRAYEIVQDLKNATYKDVATKLVQELNEDDFDSENKEQQNIKRRVYDALNVLIALGVLRKDGRKIVSDKSCRKGKEKQSNEGKEIDLLRKKVQLKKQLLKQKNRKLKEAEDKLKSITTLLMRNKQQNYEEDVIIPFPFIGVLIVGDIQKGDYQLSKEQFVLNSTNSLKPFGDMDCLNWLKESLQQKNELKYIV